MPLPPPSPLSCDSQSIFGAACQQPQKPQKVARMQKPSAKRNKKKKRKENVTKKAAQAQSGHFPALFPHLAFPLLLRVLQSDVLASTASLLRLICICNNNSKLATQLILTRLPKLAVPAHWCHCSSSCCSSSTTGHIGVVSYPACQFACGPSAAHSCQLVNSSRWRIQLAMFSLKLNLNYDDDVAKIVSLHIVDRMNGCYDMITLMRLRVEMIMWL